MKYRVSFYDKNGTEARSLVVEADSDLEAEDEACLEADREGWPDRFKVSEAVPMD